MGWLSIFSFILYFSLLVYVSFILFFFFPIFFLSCSSFLFFPKEYPLEVPGWSCAWGTGPIVYVGLANGQVHAFDTRMPRVGESLGFSEVPNRRPVHSLAYLSDSSSDTLYVFPLLSALFLLFLFFLFIFCQNIGPRHKKDSCVEV